jgi:anti-anti-sigma factor
MTGDQPPSCESTPLSQQMRVDAACDRFEKAWKGGQGPRIEEYLAEVPEPDRVPLFRELLALEIELRCGEAENSTPEEYKQRFPGHDGLIEAVFAQVSRDRSRRLPDSDEGATTPDRSPPPESAGDVGPPPPSGSPPAPDQIGRYRVVRRLDGGTYGDVYLAHDAVMDRQVAVKVPSVRLLATDRAREEFLREARSVARLKHGGIVGAYDFGQEADGRCYIVYEFVDGESLAERIKPERIAADPLPPDEAARIVAGVAEALHYAHLQGLVHRDIKPANILVDRQGRPKVTDFGLAVREEELAQQRGILAGTLPYMSPEQVRREGHRLDGRSDIYSLGVVLYELLCGRRPFTATKQDELSDQILNREARPPRQIRDSIPRELERICLKALSKQINDRYTTVGDMAEELWQAARAKRPPVQASREVPLPAPFQSEVEAAPAPLMEGGRDHRSSSDPCLRPNAPNSPPMVVVASGPTEGTAYPLEKARVLIGRNRDCDICFQYATMARYQAQLVRTDRGYSLEDLDSGNGSYVNGELAVGRVPLQDGDRIHTGSLILIYRHRGGSQQRVTRGATEEKAKLHLDQNVQFSVYRPSAVQPQRWYTMLAFAHLSEHPPDAERDQPDPIEEMQRQARQVLGEKLDEYRGTTQDSQHPVPRDGELTFVPEVPGVEFNPPSRSFVWEEAVHREEFRLRASPELDGQTARGRLTVFLGGIILAEVSLSIPVDSSHRTGSKTDPHEVERAQPYRRIFASYSRKDRWVVEQFKKYGGVLGDEYVKKHISLRAGEERSGKLQQLIEEADIFQLFWSTNSMHSSFIRREWEYALSLRRANFIRPCYWENPLPTCPEKNLPPEELRRVHFQRIPLAMRAQTASDESADRNEGPEPSQRADRSGHRRRGGRTGRGFGPEPSQRADRSGHPQPSDRQPHAGPAGDRDGPVHPLPGRDAAEEREVLPRPVAEGVQPRRQAVVDSAELEGLRSYLLNLARGELVSAGFQRRYDAEDLVQEVLLKAHKNRANFRGQTEAELVKWLQTILKNEVVDFTRRLGGLERELSESEDRGTPSPATRFQLIRIEQQGDVAAVHILCAELREQHIVQLKDELDPLHFTTARQVVLDMGAVQHLSSGAVGVLLWLQKHVRGQGGELRLRGVRPSVAELLVTCGPPPFVFDDVLRPEGEHTTPFLGDRAAVYEEMRGREAMLGDYVVDRHLGSGGLGMVYLAHHASGTLPPAAIKVLRGGVDAKERLQGEYDRLSKLQHPGIVRARGFGIQDVAPYLDGALYLVTDYVEGVCLSAWLREHRPTGRQAALIVASVAEALAHAHSQGVVHRNVKPSNIILTGDLCPVLLGFGLSIARYEAGESTPEQAQATGPPPAEHSGSVDVVADLTGNSPLIVGTPAYMSPEQARGDGQRVDGRSDVYSLGVILYEMLCGRLPFPGSDGGVAEVLRRVLEEDPSPLRQLAPEIPRDLEAICLKAMAKCVADRYPTAADLAADLRGWLAGSDGPAGPVIRHQGWKKAVVVAVVAAAVLAGLLALRFFF